LPPSEVWAIRALGSRYPRGSVGVPVAMWALLEEEKGETDVPLFARTREQARCAVCVGARHRFGKLRVMLSSPACRLRPRPRAGATSQPTRWRAAPRSGKGYRRWARRNGRLEDIHSLEGRYDHDVDELMA
jgi:hypothetical protein